jgi:hypothetical protein
MLRGSAERPDILVTEPNVSPVVVETEVVPAVTVEKEAIARLGKSIKTTGRKILSSIAVRVPLRMRSVAGIALREEMAAATDLEMALYTGDGAIPPTRWPTKGWIVGGIVDLALLVQSASVPPEVIEKAVDDLVIGVSEAAGQLAEMDIANPGAMSKICEQLKQESSEQTRRMATTILANAFVFQESLSGGPAKLRDVKSLSEMKVAGFSKSVVLAEWKKILAVNYWPIFDIARRILEVIPAANAKEIIFTLSATAERLIENHLMRSHDLTGAVFQRLIADRKFLAAYYTTPASAALLVGLAIMPNTTPANGSWKNPEDVESLRIGDFACGTGTLISMAYQRIGQLHEIHGGDSERLHPAMMATSLVGCDVMPAAAHLTASMLSGAHPTVKYTDSSVMTVAYGKQPNGSIALGSLDMLEPQAQLSMLAITAKTAGGTGQGHAATWHQVPHESFDLVVMNPPFTRATGHEGAKVGVPNPMFAAFANDKAEQKAMGEATKRLTEGTSAHGNAGEASIFLVLGHRMLKSGGMLGLVMPLSLVAGDSWEGSRGLLADHYSDLVVVSISGTKSGDISFSADTGMGECLFVGRKKMGGVLRSRTSRATFVVLKERPAFPMMGAQASRQIRRAIAFANLRRLEDGPIGGTPLTFGDDVIGFAIDAPIPSDGTWALFRIADLSLAQTAFQIVGRHRLWLPATAESEAIPIPMTLIRHTASIGPYHADVVGLTTKGDARGPFSRLPLKPGAAPTYPILWEHDANRERTMLFEADSEGILLPGKDAIESKLIAERALKVLGTASHCHFNRDFRFNSQSTSMQFTERKTIGGRAWIALKLSSELHEKALVLWSNTTLGLLVYWWHANKQQAGRGSIGKLALEELPILDLSSLSASQLKEAGKIFDTLCTSSLLPMNEIEKDATRANLDAQFFVKVLGLPQSFVDANGPLSLLRRKLALEPSVAGQK